VLRFANEARTGPSGATTLSSRTSAPTSVGEAVQAERVVALRDPAPRGSERRPAPHAGERLQPPVRSRQDRGRLAPLGLLGDRPQERGRDGGQVDGEDEHPVARLLERAREPVDRRVALVSVAHEPRGAERRRRRLLGDDENLVEDLREPTGLELEKGRRAVRQRGLRSPHPPRRASREDGGRPRESHRTPDASSPAGGVEQY
jgi:hypothetical protein